MVEVNHPLTKFNLSDYRPLTAGGETTFELIDHYLLVLMQELKLMGDYLMRGLICRGKLALMHGKCRRGITQFKCDPHSYPQVERAVPVFIPKFTEHHCPVPNFQSHKG